MPTRWYPTPDQLSTPDKAHMALKQVLQQHYTLVDQHAKTVAALAEAQAQLAKLQQGPGRGNGPTDTTLLGVLVQPADLTTLASGATLRWDKNSGTFVFS